MSILLRDDIVETLLDQADFGSHILIDSGTEVREGDHFLKVALEFEPEDELGVYTDEPPVVNHLIVEFKANQWQISNEYLENEPAVVQWLEEQDALEDTMANKGDVTESAPATPVAQSGPLLDFDLLAVHSRWRELCAKEGTIALLTDPEGNTWPEEANGLGHADQISAFIQHEELTGITLFVQGETGTELYQLQLPEWTLQRATVQWQQA